MRNMIPIGRIAARINLINIVHCLRTMSNDHCTIFMFPLLTQIQLCKGVRRRNSQKLVQARYTSFIINVLPFVPIEYSTNIF